MSDRKLEARIKAVIEFVRIGVVTRFEGERTINDTRMEIGLLPLAHLFPPDYDDGSYGIGKCPKCEAKIAVKLLGVPDDKGAYMVSALCPACEFHLETYTPHKIALDDPAWGNLFKKVKE